MIKNILITLIAGIIVYLSAMFIIKFVGFLLDVYLTVRENRTLRVKFSHGKMLIPLTILIMIETYLILL